mmetsp:Transcript_121720/g.239061  ORF Transcript_121720/g.239061 Transcript_121720/m.239061 type:complete len:132 (+) Transcript_121720:40-435(+)|eukprot:CAMPEP_0170392776 /NCGR_PEP_ID=MMETSP0117_2-20130122/20371_1 /TAXON_ID=400756 /ORGANISM="Durinskia baltica, Strain CSIRO CS-38" /LENGTH=131 /DNA_ID=CAMNT_0010648933 /DNA_START=46 /DNA_END=441 /DNA_ORIENTATION=+
MELEPNQTIYIKNINEKVKKDVLKKQLYMLFSQYGRVKKIVACKGIKLRGQAWVVFQDVNSATNAMKGKQAFIFYDKPMQLSYAKEKTHSGAGKVSSSAPPSNKNPKRARANSNDENDEQDSEGFKAPRME